MLGSIQHYIKHTCISVLTVYSIMLKLVALLTLVCGVWTQDERCCTPDVWEGEIHTYSGFVRHGIPQMEAVGYLSIFLFIIILVTILNLFQLLGPPINGCPRSPQVTWDYPRPPVDNHRLSHD